MEIVEWNPNSKQSLDIKFEMKISFNGFQAASELIVSTLDDDLLFVLVDSWVDVWDGTISKGTRKDTNL